MTDKELEKIYNEAYRAVYWTSMALMKNESDAEDIVQDTFISLIESYDTIKDKTKVLPWLKKVAANKSLNRLKLTRTFNADDEFLDNVEAVPDDFLPQTIVESSETRKIVMGIIENSLSDDIRMTLILYYFDELSIREISEALNVPQGTVSWRLNFAKKKIKKEVEKYENDNDTKLYMALPFLTELFMKEAEQVPFKPMPASLIKLSASQTAPHTGAATKAVSATIKKGTGLIMKKVIFGITAAVVSVGIITGGIVYVVNHKDEGKDKDKKSKIERSEDDEEDIKNDIVSEGNSEEVSDSGSGDDDEVPEGYMTFEEIQDLYDNVPEEWCTDWTALGENEVMKIESRGIYVKKYFMGLKVIEPLIVFKITNTSDQVIEWEFDYIKPDVDDKGTEGGRWADIEPGETIYRCLQIPVNNSTLTGDDYKILDQIGSAFVRCDSVDPDTYASLGDSIELTVDYTNEELPEF